jgi:hypothetical protein
MRALGGWRCLTEADDSEHGHPEWAGLWQSRVLAADLPSSTPDLTDPATLGCLLAEVRRLSGDPCAHVMPAGGVWKVYYRRPTRPTTQVVYGGTEGTALLGALADILEVTP